MGRMIEGKGTRGGKLGSCCCCELDVLELRRPSLRLLSGLPALPHGCASPARSAPEFSSVWENRQRVRGSYKQER